MSGPMPKELHILGLLLARPRTGYELHRIVVAHGEVFTDLKKGNVYYLLERLAKSGMLTMTAEGGARGPRRERLVYAITEQGRQRFQQLLREVIRTYDAPHSGIEVAMIFLPHLDLTEAIHLLEERRAAVLARRALVDGNDENHGDAAHNRQLHQQLEHDHLVSMMEAELAWIERSLKSLHQKNGDLA